MSQSIHWDTTHLSCPADYVTIFSDRERAEGRAKALREYYATNGLRRSVRIMPRTVKVATLHLNIFAVVTKC